MKGFLGLTRRNLLIYFKDKQSVAFSLLTSIIVLVLYLLFLKSSFVSGMNGVLDEYEGLNMLVTADDIDVLANMFLLTGILGSAMITVPFNCLSTVVRDRENKIDFDILATPIKRGQIVLSYFVSSTLSSIILNSIILTIGLLATGAEGGLYMSTSDILSAYGIVMLGSLSATSIFMILVLMFKTSSASGSFFGILSAASGFVIGAYIPISEFSQGVRTVCNIFPASQITIMLRNFLMNGTLNHIDEGIGGLDNGMFAESIREAFTFKAGIFDFELEIPQMLIYVGVSVVIFIALQILVYSKTYKKKS